ncbi:alpha-1,3-mannosyl-glycoprotein 4-beta-N-acetylglucosaminyltransferase A, partial [Biomphalaria glabrata]
MRLWVRRKLLIGSTLTLIFFTLGLQLVFKNSKRDRSEVINDNILRQWLENKSSFASHSSVQIQPSPAAVNQSTSPVFQETAERKFVFIYEDEKSIGNDGWSVPRMPGLFAYLPHLTANKSLLLPEFKISKGRNNVTFVIGIPSIRRPIDVYLINTLQSLIQGMNETEKTETVLIVCITEPWNISYEKKIILDIIQKFPKELDSGLLEVITPQAGYYPDLSQLKAGLGDPHERVKWRSKQNLDYAYLMLYSWKRGSYYLQLEDDIQASPGFIGGMKSAISGNYGDWFLLQFSTLGFIGRLFKSQDVPKVMEFLFMFYASKPCDWLLEDFLRVRMCGHGDIWAYCIHKIRSVARLITPTLFQHEGFHSSFSGNVNKLKDKSFGTGAKKIFFNPPLSGIINNLQAYSKYDIYALYNGDDIFWGGNPKAGDVIDFIFDHPVPLARIHIESGNSEHPGDIIREASLEILPDEFVDGGNLTRKTTPFSEKEKAANIKRYDFLPQLKNLNDTYHVLGTFNSDGAFILDVPPKYGRILILRIAFHSNSQTWVLIKK